MTVALDVLQPYSGMDGDDMLRILAPDMDKMVRKKALEAEGKKNGTRAGARDLRLAATVRVSPLARGVLIRRPVQLTRAKVKASLVLFQLGSMAFWACKLQHWSSSPRRRYKICRHRPRLAGWTRYKYGVSFRHGDVFA